MKVDGTPNFLNNFLKIPSLKLGWLSECRDGGSPTNSMKLRSVEPVSSEVSLVQGKNFLNSSLLV